jgi:hypothetical protein
LTNVKPELPPKIFGKLLHGTAAEDVNVIAT